MSGIRIIIRNPPGGDLVELGTQFIYRGGWEVVQKAEEGAVGTSTLTLDDPDLSLWAYLGLNVGGRQQIRLVDIDSDKIVHFGFTGKRSIKRKYDDKGHPTGRAWSVDIWDVNTILQRRILTHNGARRKRESDVDRIMALFDFPEWGIISQVIVGPSETTMSKHDYRGMTVGQYIADCAQASRKNYWCDIVDIGDGDHQTFWYGRDTRSAYESTISISNDLADLDLAALRAGTATTFPPSKDTEYSMDPSRVVDGIWASGEKTSVYRRRPATSDVFGLRWDLANQWPTVHDKDRLIAKAESMLERLKDEQEIIETSINVPASQAHLIRAGMLIPVKLTHVPAVSDFTDCRVLSRGLSPRGDGRRYSIPLTLEPVGPSPAEPAGVIEALGDNDAQIVWEEATVEGQLMVALMGIRELAVSDGPDDIYGPWTLLTPAEHEGDDDSSMNAAYRVAGAAEGDLVNWGSTSQRPSMIAVKFSVGSAIEDSFRYVGFPGAASMTISGIVTTGPAVIVAGVHIHNFDTPPPNPTLTPPGDGFVQVFSNKGLGGFDYGAYGYLVVGDAGTYSLTWTSSNGSPPSDWQYELQAVVVS